MYGNNSRHVNVMTGRVAIRSITVSNSFQNRGVHLFYVLAFKFLHNVSHLHNATNFLLLHTRDFHLALAGSGCLKSFSTGVVNCFRFALRTEMRFIKCSIMSSFKIGSGWVFTTNFG